MLEEIVSIFRRVEPELVVSGSNHTDFSTALRVDRVVPYEIIEVGDRRIVYVKSGIDKAGGVKHVFTTLENNGSELGRPFVLTEIDSWKVVGRMNKLTFRRREQVLQLLFQVGELMQSLQLR